MGITLAGQTVDFLFSLGLGVCFGLFYEFFRIARLFLKSGAIFIFFQDIFYFIACSFATFGFFQIRTNGEVRLYILLGIFLGWVFYYFSIGSIVYNSLKFILEKIGKLFKWINKHVFLYMVIKIHRFFNFFSSIGCKFKNKLKKT